MRGSDVLVVKKVEYRSDHLYINADILRIPFQSPYIAPRHENHYCGQDIEFFDPDFQRRGDEQDKSRPPQLR